MTSNKTSHTKASTMPWYAIKCQKLCFETYVMPYLSRISAIAVRFGTNFALVDKEQGN